MKNKITGFLAMIGMTLFLLNSCEKKEEINKPVVSTLRVSTITQTTAKISATISDDGGVIINMRGVCWSTKDSPTINDSKTEDGTGDGDFESSITGLEPNTTYFVRAYATNEAGTSYGSSISFTTLDETANVDLPTLSTAEVTDISSTTVTSGGNITNNEAGVAITARGVCWGTKDSPTIDDNKTEDGTGGGSFVSSITGLEPSTTYFVRAYAVNEVGTGYGNTISFTTLSSVETPTLTTAEISGITKISATSGGNISDDGGAEITARGICWSMNEFPTIDDNKTEDGIGTGTFTSNITGIASNTTFLLGPMRLTKQEPAMVISRHSKRKFIQMVQDRN